MQVKEGRGQGVSLHLELTEMGTGESQAPQHQQAASKSEAWRCFCISILLIIIIFFFWLPSEVCKLQMVAAHSQLSSGSLCWCFSVLGDRSPQLVEVLVCEGSHCGSWLACAHRSAHRWAGNENKPCSMQSDPAVAMRRPTAAGKRMELRTRQQIQVWYNRGMLFDPKEVKHC